MIDFSCADEVVAKLLMRYVVRRRAAAMRTSFSAASTSDHWDAIEAVLERHGLALAVEKADGVRSRRRR